MSTRCNIIVVDEWTDVSNPVILYRHSDGCPEGVEKSLDEFIDHVITERIRDNATQAAGWFVVMGMREYEKYDFHEGTPNGANAMGWKVGAYEPTTGIHDDVRYVHIVDLVSKSWASFDLPKTHRHGKWLAKRIRKMRHSITTTDHTGGASGRLVSDGATISGKIADNAVEQVFPSPPPAASQPHA